MRTYVSTFVLFALLFGLAQSYSSYRSRIPNGLNVPHPCFSNGTIWPGVGHWKSGGGGERNPFGIAFYQNGQVWNRTLCMMDSDRDGKSNGVELGDPDCVWIVNGTPAQAAGSHPGICEPLNSLLCIGLNADKFTCGSVALKGTFGVVLGFLLLAFLSR